MNFSSASPPPSFNLSLSFTASLSSPHPSSPLCPPSFFLRVITVSICTSVSAAHLSNTVGFLLLLFFFSSALISFSMKFIHLSSSPPPPSSSLSLPLKVSSALWEEVGCTAKFVNETQRGKKRKSNLNKIGVKEL